MSYSEDIIKQVEDPDIWPHIPRHEFIDELNAIGDEAFSKKTIEGLLASLLIYHQITEDMIRTLIDCSTFFLQLSIFPNELAKRDLNGKMFGQLVGESKQSVLDDETKEFIKKSQELNAIRIRMVHKLTLKTSVRDISRQTTQIKKLFDSIFQLYSSIYDNYRGSFHYHRKHVDELKEALE